MARIFEGICAEEEYRRIKEGFNKALDKFAEGDLKAGEFVRDSTDGKPPQSVALTDPNGDALKIIFHAKDAGVL